MNWLQKAKKRIQKICMLEKDRMVSGPEQGGLIPPPVPSSVPVWMPPMPAPAPAAAPDVILDTFPPTALFYRHGNTIKWEFRQLLVSDIRILSKAGIVDPMDLAAIDAGIHKGLLDKKSIMERPEMLLGCDR